MSGEKQEVQRTIILLLDSFGIGAAEDARKYDDEGSNTLGHILEHFPNIQLSNLEKLGLINCLKQSCGKTFGKAEEKEPTSYYGFAKEISSGKDTVSGHWELMGYPVTFDWGYFKEKTNSFPQDLLETIYKKGNISGSLGNCAGSGTEILEEFGEEHIKTFKPIFYTSADSVFQIIAHEEAFGLKNLYTLCQIVRKELYKYNICRVIARPFIGTKASNFTRTANRKDYSIQPQENTLLDIAKENNIEVVSIGKIADIFANKGITQAVKSSTIPNLANSTLQAMQKYQDKNTIIFTNFVDFDSSHGHRRDVKGYKEALEYFDIRLVEIIKNLQDNDLLVITADHGCDPTWKGNDHTREHIPVIFYNKKLGHKNIGACDTYADVGQSIAKFMMLPQLKYGRSFI